jgi:Alr-MurF fusion protein
MLSYRLSEIARVVGGQIEGSQDPLIQHIFTDSRSPMGFETALFLALIGERHDGHSFIPDLYKQGVRNFLISSKTLNKQDMPDACFLVVKDTLSAIQMLAAHHRGKFTIPIIGITGSNGKTVVKEWLYHLLSKDRNIVRSPKSYNSQLGVPLSVLLLDEYATAGIFEAGISKPGEMIKIASIIKPVIGILTNIGEAHQENFKNYTEKLNEKLKLFESVETFIYCKDKTEIETGINSFFEGKKAQIFSWAKRAGADLFIKEIHKTAKGTSILGEYRNSINTIWIPFTDDASIENAIHCWLTILAMGLWSFSINRRFESLQPVAMRLELKKGINSCTLINDSYNSDFVSLIVAIDFLMQQNQNPRKTLILSDILQSGRDERDLYTQLAALIKAKGMDHFIGIGSSLMSNSEVFSIPSQFYRNTEDFLNLLHTNAFSNEAILLKGARSFEFERISDALELKSHSTCLEINLNALAHNLNYFRSLLTPGTRIMVMVKALSYGSGTFEIANMLQFQKADYLAVAYSDEGVELRRAGILLPIMVMNPEFRSFESIIDHRLEPEIYNISLLNKFIQFLQEKGLKYFPVHIKLDTGMHRLGFNEEDLQSVIEKINQSELMTVKSIFSHLAASEDPKQDEFTATQIHRFERMSKTISDALPYPIIRHILNSAGIERFARAQFEMVRLGIGLYGISSADSTKLRNIGTLKTIISQLRVVKAGETIGYGRSGIALNDMRVAVIPIGYADGIDRKLGNGVAKFLVNGKFAPTIGNICMDMCMIDVTAIKADEGDTVILFGEDLPVHNLAKALGTIPYEILTSISSRVNRVYYQE